MMNEWGIPTLYISALTYKYVHKLASKGKHVPDIILAGGFAFEDDIFKAIALGAPYVKAVGMARPAICAAHVGKLLGEQIETKNIDRTIEMYGKTMDEIFVLSSKVERLFNDNGRKVPPGAIGVYSYYQRLSQGLRQLMCGSRKFALRYLTRDDVVSLTREAADITGLRYIMDADAEQAELILAGKEKNITKTAAKQKVAAAAKSKIAAKQKTISKPKPTKPIPKPKGKGKGRK